MKKRAVRLVMVSFILYTFVLNVPAQESPDKDISHTMTSSDPIQVLLNEKNVLFPTRSLDGNNIAFGFPMDFTKEEWGKIGILHLADNSLTEIALEETRATGYEGIEWIDSDKIAFIGHINPGLSSYEIYDIHSKKRTQTFYGIGFVWDQEKHHIYYTLPQPHFGQMEKGKNKIMMDEDIVLYESPSNVIITGGPGISANGNIAFFEEDLSSGELELVQGQIKDSKVQVTQKTSWSNMRGKIEWKNDEELEIHSNDQITKFNITNQEITER